MKQIKYLLRAGSLLIMGLLAQHLNAQSVGDGRIDARFGIDGDVEKDAVRYGRAALSGTSQLNDDWFVNPAVTNLGGMGIIKESNAAFHKSVLQSHINYRRNYIFTEGMSVPKLTRSGGYILLDALYARDHQDNDKTHINGPSGLKLIDDPSTWVIGTKGSITDKTDIMEFYSHVRRKGTTVFDSLFFYFGVGIYGNNGSKNVVAELFVNDVQYDTSAQEMTGLGPHGGRVAWRINGAGGVVGIGDMIMVMTYNLVQVLHLNLRYGCVKVRTTVLKWEMEMDRVVLI